MRDRIAGVLLRLTGWTVQQELANHPNLRETRS